MVRRNFIKNTEEGKSGKKSGVEGWLSFWISSGWRDGTRVVHSVIGVLISSYYLRVSLFKKKDVRDKIAYLKRISDDSHGQDVLERIEYKKGFTNWQELELKK